MKKAGYTKGKSYQMVMYEVAKARGEDPTKQKHTTLGYKGRTVKELMPQYKAARAIMKREDFTPKAVKKEMQSKRAQTFTAEYNVPSDVSGSKEFYTLLSSDNFKKLSEYVSSQQLLKMSIEAFNSGRSAAEINKSLSDFLKSMENKDDFYIEDLENLINGNSEDKEQE